LDRQQRSFISFLLYWVQQAPWREQPGQRAPHWNQPERPVPREQPVLLGRLAV